MKRHSHCLALSAAGPQSQTYYISYDSYTEHLRWHRTASKVSMSKSSHIYNHHACSPSKNITLCSEKTALKMQLYKSNKVFFFPQLVFCFFHFTFLRHLNTELFRTLAVNMTEPVMKVSFCIRLDQNMRMMSTKYGHNLL